jgi:Protein of unknown function (DUF1997)
MFKRVPPPFIDLTPMQSQVNLFQSIEPSESLIQAVSAFSSDSNYTAKDNAPTAQEVTLFHTRFVDRMEMAMPAQEVATYLDTHHDWFRRCAHPMRVEPIGENSYALVIGKFGSFGYEIEPKVGLNLLPQADGVYRIETVAVPGYESVGYDVDFNAAMELVEPAWVDAPCNPGDAAMTYVQWQLDLTVKIQFPRFIHALPKSLIQTTGDRLLRNIVRQVSNRLTSRVQTDFHTTHGLPIPQRSQSAG